MSQKDRLSRGLNVIFFTLLKWIGAGYLVYLGVGMVRPLVMGIWQGNLGGGTSVLASRPGGSSVNQSSGRLFWRGFSL